MYLYNWRPITRLLNPGGVLKEFLGGDLPLGPKKPLANTRASSTEFCYPILDLTPQIPPILNLNLPICFFLYFWVAIPGFPSRLNSIFIIGYY